MSEGTIRFERDGAEAYAVLSDVHSDYGAFHRVGRVRRQADYSVTAKTRCVPTYLWFASGGNGNPEHGPYASRKAAADALV